MGNDLSCQLCQALVVYLLTCLQAVLRQKDLYGLSTSAWAAGIGKLNDQVASEVRVVPLVPADIPRATTTRAERKMGQNIRG